MNISFYIAKRYLFAKKSTNAINIISGISVIGVFVGSAALIIILSVFNGFEDMVLKMVNTFSPQILITPETGKTFDPGTPYFEKLKKNRQIYSYTEVLSENAVLKYRGKQAVGLIKGVDQDFLKNKALDSITIEGKFIIKNGNSSFAVIGSALQAYLLVNTEDPFTRMQIFSPGKKGALSGMAAVSDLTILDIPVAGVYEVQQEYDKIAIVPINFARTLLNEERNISSIEINLVKGTDPEKFKASVKQDVGDAYTVQSRIEQNKALYNVLGSEKWMVYIILTFILIIALFNIVGSLTMLVIEKKQDIAILKSLGAGEKLIKRIFLFEGLMITLAGCAGGLLAGFVFCVLQANFGLVKMGKSGAI
ncbi:MAG: FtsX-like permease family protein, partial [Flavobacterium sp.]